MKGNAWGILGIAPTEDVRAIKRAYSARLKTCRPEDDAEAFANLRAAYEMLLARAEQIAKQRAAQAAREAAASVAGDDVSPPVPSAMEPQAAEQNPAAPEPASPEPAAAVPAVDPIAPPAPPLMVVPLASTAAPTNAAVPPSAAPPNAVVPPAAPPPAAAASPGPALQASYDPRALAAEIIAQANQPEPSRGLGVLPFKRWLAAHPALVSLQVKQAAGHALLAAFGRGAGAPQQAMQALSEFFGWDDPLERRRLAQAGLSLDAVTAQLELAELQQWVKDGLARKDVQARRLERIRRAGDHGVRAWWLALVAVGKFRPLLTLNQVLKQHSYRALERYLGAPTLRFWQNLYAPQPNRAQWLRVTGQSLLFGVLCVLTLFPFLALTEVDHHVDWRAASTTVATMTLLLLVWRCSLLAARWIKGRASPAWRERLALCRRWLGFAPLNWRLLPLAGALLLPAWYWPAAWPTWPYALVLGILLLLQVRTGWAIVAALLISMCGVAILGSMLPDQQAQTLACWLSLPTACVVNYVHHAQARTARPARKAKGGYTISWRTVLAILWLLSILLRGFMH